MEKLLAELKSMLVEILDMPDITAEDIKPDEPLVGGDLGIDSIDILEMVMTIEKNYGVTIDSKELGEKVFATLRTLAEYVYHDKVGRS
jgi:acyl carrier protein